MFTYVVTYLTRHGCRDDTTKILPACFLILKSLRKNVLSHSFHHYYTCIQSIGLRACQECTCMSIFFVVSPPRDFLLWRNYMSLRIRLSRWVRESFRCDAFIAFVIFRWVFEMWCIHEFLSSWCNDMSVLRVRCSVEFVTDWDVTHLFSSWRNYMFMRVRCLIEFVTRWDVTHSLSSWYLDVPLRCDAFMSSWVRDAFICS